MNDSGWIKLHRSLLDWEWYSDINATRLFVHLIIKANHVDKRWQGHEIKRGQLITSYQNLAAETGLSVKQVRVALNKLKNTGEVASKSTNKFTLLTLVKYGVYQYSEVSNGTQQGKQVANKGQAEGKRGASKGQQLKNDKNYKNERTKEDIDREFEIFWNLYSKKTGKEKALTKWGRLSDDDRMKIFSHVPLYVAATPEKRFRKDPLTYLNGKHWEDEIETKSNGTKNGTTRGRGYHTGQQDYSKQL